MNFDEQISAFMDGALSTEEETEFLHILSVSPEKRALFHSYLGVQSAMTADARTAAVPSSLDNAVLGAAGALTALSGTAGSAAGGATAAGGAATGAGTAIIGGAAAWWTTGKIISAVVIGLSLFGAGYFLSDRLASTDPSIEMAQELSADAERVETTTQRNNATTEAHAGSLLSDNSIAGENSSPGAGNISGGDVGAGTANSSSTSARIVYRNVYITRVDTVFMRDSDEAKPTIVSRVDTVTLALMQSAPQDRPITINEAPRRDLAISLPGRIEIELQREHLSTWPYIDYDRIGVSREQQQFAAAAAYVFDRHHAAGLYLGQKSFALEYFRVSGDSLYLYQQQPALLHGGGFYRFSYPVAHGITPEFTLQLGGSDLGPILGGRLGVQLAPTDRISVILGVNGALLAYRYNDKLFTSHSLGLSYGLRYRF